MDVAPNHRIESHLKQASLFPALSLSLLLDFDQLKISTESKLQNIAAMTAHLILKSSFEPHHNTSLNNAAAKDLHVSLDDIVDDGKASKLLWQKAPVAQTLWQPVGS